MTVPSGRLDVFILSSWGLTTRLNDLSSHEPALSVTLSVNEEVVVEQAFRVPEGPANRFGVPVNAPPESEIPVGRVLAVPEQSEAAHV